MNGLKFVRKVREISAAVKVLLMSAFELNSDELSGLGDAKIDGFIQKPVDGDNDVIMIEKESW
jgi:two-component SAPR family response regulator